MNSTELLQLVTKTLEDNKAKDITALDVSQLTTAMDTMLICTATSKRHAKSIADKVIEASKKSGVKPFGVEGEKYGEWILIDLSDVVVHIMLAEQREFYLLEKLWTVTENVRKKTV